MTITNETSIAEDLAKEIGKQEQLTEELETLADGVKGIDQEEAQSWITTIIRAIFSALK